MKPCRWGCVLRWALDAQVKSAVILGAIRLAMVPLKHSVGQNYWSQTSRIQPQGQECNVFLQRLFYFCNSYLQIIVAYAGILELQYCIIVLSEKQFESILFASFVTCKAAALYVLCNCFNYKK